MNKILEKKRGENIGSGVCARGDATRDEESGAGGLAGRSGEGELTSPSLYKCRGVECSPTAYTKPEERSRKASDARERKGIPRRRRRPAPTNRHRRSPPRRAAAGDGDAKI